MKDFVKMVLAVICGFILTGIFCLVLSLGFLGAVLAAGSSAPVLPKSGVLRIDLSGIVLGEQTQEANPFDGLSPLSGSGSGADIIGIWDAVQAVHAAAEDPAVKFIYLCPDGNLSSVTALGELREALAQFRATSGKPVVTYTESPSTGGYYLASVSDKIYMTPDLGVSGQLTGVSSQMLFFGDLLKRLGVNVQLIRHGKYKSAGEMYTRGSSSPENREQYQRMTDSMWETIGSRIAAGRGIPLAQLDEAIESLKLNLPQDYVDCGLVDELLGSEALENKLAALAVEERYKDVKWIGFADYVAVKAVPGKARRKIAVIYADGEIVDGGGRSDVAGDRFASVIAKVRADSSVKAVVLRVNSPGGSVLASEKIKEQIDLLRADKPVVASYGSYAASGGYWISSSCEKIFAGAGTLTGSIGVFGMVPDLSKTVKDIAHIGVENITSHKHGDMYSLMRPFDADEYAHMQASIEAVYDRFTDLVAEGRGLPKETVDAVGQGRVWTGADALTIHLVDEIGTLEDAIRYAAVAGGDPDLGQWTVQGYPAPPSAMEQILDMLGKGSGENAWAAALRKAAAPRILVRMENDIRIR